MIETLYEPFREWSSKGSVWIISDTHFDDALLLADDKYQEKFW